MPLPSFGDRTVTPEDIKSSHGQPGEDAHTCLHLVYWVRDHVTQLTESGLIPSPDFLETELGTVRQCYASLIKDQLKTWSVVLIFSISSSVLIPSSRCHCVFSSNRLSISSSPDVIGPRPLTPIPNPLS